MDEHLGGSMTNRYPYLWVRTIGKNYFPNVLPSTQESNSGRGIGKRELMNWTNGLYMPPFDQLKQLIHES